MTARPLGTIERADDGGFIRFERSLNDPIEAVWAAITEPARLAEWWPPFAAEISIDLRVGGTLIFEWPDIKFPTMEFTITKSDAPRLLEHTHSAPGAWLRYDLTPTAPGTHLLVTYFVPDLTVALQRGDAAGLHHSLDRLAPALSGQPVAWDNEAFPALFGAYAATAPTPASPA
ncbi:MAG: SRPBCC family protein [Propionibacteriaceae bacterium]|nr:SRPBCC family protein [Micropruina sp.]